MSTIKLKNSGARNFFASLMVDSDGEKALAKVEKDSPMYHAIKVELEHRSSAKK